MSDTFLFHFSSHLIRGRLSLYISGYQIQVYDIPHNSFFITLPLKNIVFFDIPLKT